MKIGLTYGAFDKAYPSAPGLNDKTRFFSEALLLCIARNNPALAEIGKLFGKDLTADEAHREFFQWVKGLDGQIQKKPRSVSIAL